MSKKKENIPTPTPPAAVAPKKIPLRIYVGIALLLIAVYMFISFTSFVLYWDVDQSLLQQSLAGDQAQAASNWGGNLGNLLGNFFITQWAGVAALLLPIVVALAALRVLQWCLSIRTGKVIFSLLVFMLLVSLSFGVLSSGQSLIGVGLGGMHGHSFGHNVLISIFGKAGAIILLLLGYLVLGYYCFPHLMHRWGVALVHRVLRAMGREVPTLAALATDTDEQSITREHTRPNFIDGLEGVVPFDLDDDMPEDQPEEGEEKADEKPPLNPRNATPGLTFTIEAPEEEEEEDTPPAPEQHTPEVQPDLEVAPSQEGEPTDVLASLLPYDPKADLQYYKYPTPDLLDDYQKNSKSVSPEELEANKDKIVSTLGHYNISISEIKATIGPTITLYEIVPSPGVRISKIKGLENDIALSLAALGIRIIAPIPGKGTIGIEVPNQKPEIVPMQAIIKSPEFQDTKFDLPIALGKTITNKAFVLDLAKMPHLLIAGATGQGKSVGLNAILTSLLYKMHPSQLKFVLVDPKKVELPLYGLIEKHFLAKLPDADEAIITDNQKVIYTINSLCIEMDARYELLKAAAVRNLKEYNQKFVERRLNPEKGHRYLPYIVLVIDEFADLIMTAGREVENPIARLAQLARAIGIHLIIATQRPTTNIITGLIKANFPARIAFRVTSMIDSRTILDQSGAQQLIGKGDMLVSTGSDLVRVQCAFVDLHEVERITKYIASQQGYPSAHLLPEYVPESADGLAGAAGNADAGPRDTMFEQVAYFVVEMQQGSTSMIQRRFNLGYNRAGRIMDQLETAGIVGPQEGSKPRQVKVMDTIMLEQILNK